jgi:trehalose 6-phosphate phosphatase
VHGAELRQADGTVHRATTFLDPELKTELTSIADDKPGVVIEDKGYSVAVHYRQAPHLGHDVRDEVSAVCARFTSARLEILPGKSVVEVKQPSFNKGTAVRELMQHEPFKGRRPIFIGDDVTDEAAFDVMPEFDGVGFSVGREVQGIAGTFETPAAVRRWIAEMVRAGKEKR